MAELADAADSKSADLRVLGVRLPLPAPALPLNIAFFFNLTYQAATLTIPPRKFACLCA